MKKILCSFLAVFVLCCYNSYAESTFSATKTLDTFEFTELCVSRIQKYNELYGEAISGGAFKPSCINIPIYTEDEIMAVSNSFASMTLNKWDLKITSATINWIDLAENGEDFKESFERAVIAFSALEYDAFQDELMEGLHKIGGTNNKSAIESAYSILSDTIFPKVFDNKLIWWRVVENNEKILVYSGNYDWYANYYQYSYSGKTYMYLQLIANAK